MGTRKSTLLLRIALLACAFGSAAHSLAASEPAAVLTSDETRTVETLIASLDADSFDVRQDSAVKLAAMGERIRPLLLARMRARPGSNESPELLQGIKKVLVYIQRNEDARALDDATRDFDKAIGEAPLHYMPPDPSVDARLQTPVTFDFADMPLPDAVDYFRQQSNAILFIDPALAGAAPITLRVSDMKLSLALSWVVRLLDCDYIIRGRVVVITTKEHALRLRLRGKTLRLPVEPGGQPWTVEQTTAFTLSLEKWVLHDMNVPEQPKVTVVDGGKFDLVADRAVFEQIEPLLQVLGEPGTKAVHFQPLVEDFFLKMSQPLRFSLDKKESIRQASEDLANLTGFEIGAEEVGVGTLDEGFTSKDATGFDYIAKLCEIGKVSASHSIYIDKNHIQLMPADVGASELLPCVLDLRPALKAGASEPELTQRIEQICADARLLAGDETAVPPGTFVRGCRLTLLDVWNATRVAEVIDGAAKSGKVPDLPPLPEFLKKKLPAPADPNAGNASPQPAEAPPANKQAVDE